MIVLPMTMLNILHLEDDPLDAELVFAHLEAAGIASNVTRVETRSEFLAALDNGAYDLILADYSLPMFDGLTALALLQERGIEIPFILLSGALGEEVAIESLKSGATDYVLKQQLERIAPAVRRALDEAGERAQRRQAEAERERLANYNRLLLESTGEGIFGLDTEGNCTFINAAAAQMLGYTAEALLGRHMHGAVHHSYADGTPYPVEDCPIYSVYHTGQGCRVDTEVFWRHDGSSFPVEYSSFPLLQGQAVVGAVVTFTDITDRRRQQAEIADLNARLQRAMAESHHRIKNNLQVLAALVDMQRMNAGEMIPVSELTRVSQHIRTLASLHDLLTLETKASAETLDAISLRSALEKLIVMVRATSGDRRITLTAEEIRIPLKQGSSFVLLANELISNAIKHGAGQVEVHLRLQSPVAEEGAPGSIPLIRLEVCDDGPGFPPDFDPQEAANTGLELIESLGRWDLKGTIAFENRPKGGARVVVTFPPLDSDAPN